MTRQCPHDQCPEQGCLNGVSNRPRIPMSGAAPLDFAAKGAYQCADKPCSAILDYPGVCDACGVKLARFEHNERLGPALDSIPENWRWAMFGSRMFERFVPDAGKAAALDFMHKKSKARTFVIVGPTGAGKTTLAAAMLRHIIVAAKYPGDPNGELYALAKTARWFWATELASGERTVDGPFGAAVLAPRTLVARAHVAVIDDVGKEAQGGFKGNDRSKIIADILGDRHIGGIRTIVTSGLTTAQQWSDLYGEDIARRYWDAERVTVVRL